MSLFLRATPLVRTAAPRTTTRAFTTTIHRQNIIKEAAQKVSQVVSGQVSKGVDAAVDLKESVQAAASGKGEEAKGAAAKVAGQVQGQAAELKGKAAELKGEAKAKGEEVKAKLS